jgi:uncharacterized membrane protein
MDKTLGRLEHTPPLPRINRVEASRPLDWLERGWEDLRHSTGPSLAHGFLLAAIGWVILFACSTHIDLVALAVSGFLLVGPVFGAAFYELSRLRAAGQPTTFDASLDGAISNAKSLVSLGLVLAVLAVAWAWLSRLLFERAFGAELPSISEISWMTVSQWDYAGFFTTYMATGAILAIVAFAVSAVSAPMIYDRRADTMTAIVTSIKAVFANPGAMAVWAALISALTFIGFATFLLGLVVVLPWLGHATWHAYRDLVG